MVGTFRPSPLVAHALVAQGIERRTPKPGVAGSNPAGGTSGRPEVGLSNLGTPRPRVSRLATLTSCQSRRSAVGFEQSSTRAWLVYAAPQPTRMGMMPSAYNEGRRRSRPDGCSGQSHRLGSLLVWCDFVTVMQRSECGWVVAHMRVAPTTSNSDEYQDAGRCAGMPTERSSPSRSRGCRRRTLMCGAAVGRAPVSLRGSTASVCDSLARASACLAWAWHGSEVAGQRSSDRH